MADEPGAPTAEAEGAPKQPKTPLILALLNTVAIAGALGTFIYTRVIYKRPPITETAERTRLIKQAKTDQKPDMKSGMIPFKKITVNIKPEPGNPEPAPGTSAQIKGKVHYATLKFALKVGDISRQSKVDSISPILMDRILYILGKKSFHELNTPQGRYILRSEILDEANKLLKEPLVTNVYFSEFLVQ